MTDTRAVRGVVERAFDDMGRIDVVVNNAGYGLFGAAEEVSDDQIRRQIDTNLIGSIQVIRAALPLLRAQGGGRILQLSSAGGQITFPNFSLYHTTKWAIEGFIEAVAQEVAPFNIEFTIVDPGAAKTNFGVRLVRAPAMAVYESTPAGELRRGIAAAALRVHGDPLKMVQAMIDSGERKPAPARLALGSDTYALVRTALTGAHSPPSTPRRTSRSRLTSAPEQETTNMRNQIFSNKVCIVTGEALGLGRELAKQLAASGASVVLADINEARAKEGAAQIAQRGGSATAIRVDVTDAQSVQALVEGTAANFGRIDYLFNNARHRHRRRDTGSEPRGVAARH